MAGQFTPIYQSQNDGFAGGYKHSAGARAFAFDYDGSGKLDHLVLYRPGMDHGMWIFKKVAGQIRGVYQSRSKKGIGGYDFKSEADRAFAFDYDGSGKLDHLALYRPGESRSGF